jgi:PAS domain S-box-containing protein
MPGTISPADYEAEGIPALSPSVQSETLLKPSGSTAQMLVESVVDYAIYILDLDGAVKSWNAGAQRIKGYSPQEIIGRNFRIFYTDDDARAGEPERALEMARNAGTFEAEGWRVRKDGTRLWASVTIDAVHDAAGEVVGFAKITRDATRVRTVAEQLRREKDRLTETMKVWTAAKVVADEAKALAVEAKAAAAQEKVIADEAKALAIEAKVIADEAKAAAAREKVIADEAKALAIEAKVIADEAKAVAGREKVIADEAKASAAQEKVIADEAKAAAAREKVIADEAKAAAAREKVIADEAKALAIEAKVIADEAKAFAAQEKVIADEAKAFAAQEKVIADEAKAFAAQEKVIADEAKAFAAQEKVVADEAKALAVREKVIADEAKAMAVEAKVIADEAKAIAAQEKVIADEAKAMAIEAKVIADEAKAIAAQEKVIADEAKALAVEVKVVADEAKAVAAQEKVIADEAKALAVEVKVVADEAKAVAAQEKVIADEANALAVEAKVVAEEAQVVAEEAQVIAEEAKVVAEAATAAKSQFLANMSHEIRSPMNAIFGMLQLLQSTGLSARQADYAAKACVATQALLRLLNDILEFSKIEAGKLTFEKAPFEIDAMMGDVSTLLSASLGAKPVELVFVNDQHLPKRLRGDAFRLRQVLLNLAGNAIKFTAQGEIIIEIRQVAQGPASCDIEFSVTDTGIGIAPEQLVAIFEGFNQGESSTTRRYGGTGLGLAISQRIVSLMGGQLDVESAVGTGSRFHFTLAFERTDDLDSPRPPKLPSTRREHVLIVDDNEHARTVFMNIVASFGWTSEGAGSGREALELIGRSGAGREYGLVFIDWMMPELDGWETSRRVRELLPADDVRIVVMASAHDLVKLSARMELDPDVVDALLVKPITASSLLNSLLETRSRRVDLSQALPNSQRRLSAVKILVVDDFAINLQIAGELLSLEGAEVEVADCAQQAIDKVLRSQPPFDVVLMDVQMPETDGYETTRRLRELPGMDGMIIIAMTANAMETDKAACLAAGMDDHIPKPIDISVVVDTILTHCRPSRAVGISPISDNAGNAPDRPGMVTIEVDAALQRLGNNRQLFATLAGRFIEKSDSFIDELRASLQNGAIPDATKLLHQFKGFAGTLGNAVLGALASRLETQLKETGCLSDPGGDLARLATLVEAGNATLTEIITSFGVAAATPEIAPELDSATIERMLGEIDGLLAAANMRAVSVCSELVRNMDAAGVQRLTPLVQAIDRLDFPQARAELTRLLPAFDRTPGNCGGT